MNIDLYTVVLVFAIINILQVSLVFVYFQVNRKYPGAGWWALGSAMANTGYILRFLLEDLVAGNHPDWLNIIWITNYLFLFGIACIYLGTLRFLKKRGNLPVLGLTMLVCLPTLFYFSVVQDNLFARIELFSIGMIPISFLSFLAFFEGNSRPRLFFEKIVAGLFLFQTGFYIFRAVILFINPTDSIFLATIPALNILLLALVSGNILMTGLIGLLNQYTITEINEARQRFEQIFQLSPDAVLITRLEDGLTVDMNAGISTQAGYTREDVIGKTSSEIGFWADPEDRSKLLTALETSNPVYNLKVTALRKDGTVYIASASASLINLLGVTHLISITRDVTALQNMENALAQSEAKYRRIVETAVEGVMAVDAAGRIIFSNAQFAAMLGCTVEELLGQESASFIVKDELADHYSQLNLRRLGQSANYERRFQRKDGSQLWTIISAQPVSDAEGRFEGSFGMVTDITERKKIQFALETLNTELEERVRQRTRDYLETIQRLEAEILARKNAQDTLAQLQESLVERVFSQSRKISALYDVLLDQGKLTEVSVILTKSLENIVGMMKGDAALLYDYKDGTFHQRASLGIPPDNSSGLELLSSDWLNENLTLASSDLPNAFDLPEVLRLPGFYGILAAPVKLHNLTTGALLIFWREARTLAVEDISFFTIIAEQLGIILENAHLRNILEQKAVMIERRRLSRDLHDSVTQSLHGLTLHVDTLRRRIQLGQTQKIEETLTSLSNSARQSLKEMRLLLYEMRLTPLEDIQLVNALQARLDAVEMRAGIKTVMDTLETGSWPQRWEAEMYSIAIEALNNSLKHANASQIYIQLQGTETWAKMSIRDNGKGFDPSNPSPAGIGLKSMQERAERLGGQFSIITQPGQGTQICLTLGNVPAEQGGPVSLPI